MNTMHAIHEKITPAALQSAPAFSPNKRNYAQLRLMLYSTMLAIALGPVILTAGLGYYNYNDLLRKEEKSQLEWRLEGKTRTIAAMIDSLKSVVLFTAKEDRYNELTSENNLKDLFERIKRQYPFFADLGVIDRHGIQQAYIGPYGLQGADYAKESWFTEVLARGVYISKVYLGYRQVPHFAIAVGNFDPISKQQWVLRATIDASSLQKIVDTIKTTASDDLFLIDDEQILQTKSSSYGEALGAYREKFTLTNDFLLFQTPDNLFHGIGRIKNTPWLMVLVVKRYVHHEEWVTFRNRLAFIVIASLVISLLVVYGLVTMLTNIIRRSDEMQLSLLREAEHTDRLASIGRLAAGVGHEINNPLAIINQKTGLVEDLLAISPEFNHKKTIGDCLTVINQSVDRCKAITHRLLGFARRQDVTSQSLQINTIINEVLKFLENSLIHSRIKVEFDLHKELPEVKSDHLQLQQIFLNILNNAIDAIGKDGVITITTHLVAGEVRIVIQDNGKGIPEEILPHIFEPFFTTKETGKGTGLGLSITYGLVKKLGGDITVRSHVGQGTAFTLTIPVENPTVEQKP
jgi:two-component system NtrC family sensor kinase